jgi:predicted TIM-barrel fold metal-dependent hydrolase
MSPTSAPSPTSTGAWDCHAHVFGPYARYPLAEPRSYTPPEAAQPAYLAMLASLGMQRGVLVHPSAYGLHYDCILDTLAAQRQLRGVLVARADTALKLETLRERGVRALRFSQRSGATANFAGSASFDDLRALAPRMAAAALHAELWTDCKTLPTLAPAIRDLKFPVVIDHMGGFDAQAGTSDPGFQALLSLLADGHAWVKLCAYRNLGNAVTPQTDALGLPFVDAMIAANPRQLLWGSDWPFLNVKQAPSAHDLLAQFRRWVPDGAMQDAILRANPARLYD